MPKQSPHFLHLNFKVSIFFLFCSLFSFAQQKITVHGNVITGKDIPLAVDTRSNSSGVEAQGFITKDGKKLLLINKEQQESVVRLPTGTKNAVISYVDQTTGENSPAKEKMSAEIIKLKPFSVAVIKFEQ